LNKYIPKREYPKTVNGLLDLMLEITGAKNDAALCRYLDVQAPVISKLRHNGLAVGASMLVAMSELSDMGTKELKTYLPERAKINKSISTTNETQLETIQSG
jgi:hypothetical protein